MAEHTRRTEHILHACRYRGELHELVLAPLLVQLHDKDKFAGGVVTTSELIGQGTVDLVSIVDKGEASFEKDVEMEANKARPPLQTFRWPPLLTFPCPPSSPHQQQADKGKGAAAMKAGASQGKCTVELEMQWTADVRPKVSKKIHVGKTITTVASNSGATSSKMPGSTDGIGAAASSQRQVKKREVGPTECSRTASRLPSTTLVRVRSPHFYQLPSVTPSVGRSASSTGRGSCAV